MLTENSYAATIAKTKGEIESSVIVQDPLAQSPNISLVQQAAAQMEI